MRFATGWTKAESKDARVKRGPAYAEKPASAGMRYEGKIKDNTKETARPKADHLKVVATKGKAARLAQNARTAQTTRGKGGRYTTISKARARVWLT